MKREPIQKNLPDARLAHLEPELLKSRGKLVMLFQPPSRRSANIREAAEKIREDYIEAGLTDIRIDYRDLYPVTCISATGFKA